MLKKLKAIFTHAEKPDPARFTDTLDWNTFSGKTAKNVGLDGLRIWCTKCDRHAYVPILPGEYRCPCGHGARISMRDVNA